MNDPTFSSLDPLFEQARALRADTTRAEFAFETRLLARLREARPPAHCGIGLFAWRLLPYLALVVLALGVVQVQTERESQQAEQAASLQNPEAVDLFATFP